MNTLTYSIPAIHCMHCTHTIELELAEQPGIKSVKADVSSKKVTVEFEPPADDEKIREFLREIEYPAV